MTILITGAGGFIGRHVVKLLADQKRDVICFRGDLRDPSTYEHAIKALGRFECIHLAWLGIPKLEEHAWENLNVQTRFLEFIRPHCQRLVVAGSCFEYGDARGAVKEDEAHPNTQFGLAKWYLMQTLVGSATRWRWARIFYAYPNRLTREANDHYSGATPQQITYRAPLPTVWGPVGSNPDWKPDHPERVCDFIHVDDVARGLVALLDADCDSGVYNLGTGQPRAVGEVVNLIAKRFGKPEPYPGIDSSDGFWSDQTKTERATGFKCEVPFEP